MRITTTNTESEECSIYSLQNGVIITLYSDDFNSSMSVVSNHCKRGYMTTYNSKNKAREELINLLSTMEL